jgi:hypothetical protein
MTQRDAARVSIPISARRAPRFRAACARITGWRGFDAALILVRPVDQAESHF